MKFKTHGGKFLTKSGKFACGCCGGDCCMYAAVKLEDGSYQEDDLPDTLTFYQPFFGITDTLSRTGRNYYGTSAQIQWLHDSWGYFLLGIGPGDPGCPDGIGSEGCYIEPIGSSPCLINPPMVNDPFADTYTVSITINGGAPEDVVVTRESRCVWSGTDGNGCRVTLSYNPDAGVFQQWESSFYLPLASPTFNTGTQDDDGATIFVILDTPHFDADCGWGTGSYKVAYQNTPVGGQYDGTTGWDYDDITGTGVYADNYTISGVAVIAGDRAPAQIIGSYHFTVA